MPLISKIKETRVNIKANRLAQTSKYRKVVWNVGILIPKNIIPSKLTIKNNDFKIIEYGFVDFIIFLYSAITLTLISVETEG